MNQHVESPWRTPVTKEWSIEKKDEKSKVEALQWLNGASRRDNVEKLGTPERKNEHLKPRIWLASGIKN